mmetsp:Transcript_924/g.1900  ORF Transcript_924/g.1900 Transcript_924/m.1900 type:complete len:92 (+) Transcript_924:76-351(+)
MMNLSFAAGSLLLASSHSVSAHPGLDLNQAQNQGGGDPCPFLEQKQHEERNELRGQGYKLLPTRSLAELRAAMEAFPTVVLPPWKPTSLRL